MQVHCNLGSYSGVKGSGRLVGGVEEVVLLLGLRVDLGCS